MYLFLSHFLWVIIIHHPDYDLHSLSSLLKSEAFCHQEQFGSLSHVVDRPKSLSRTRSQLGTQVCMWSHGLCNVSGWANEESVYCMVRVWGKMQEFKKMWEFFNEYWEPDHYRLTITSLTRCRCSVSRTSWCHVTCGKTEGTSRLMSANERPDHIPENQWEAKLLLTFLSHPVPDQSSWH